MNVKTIKSAWAYEICVITGNTWHDRHYKGVTYTNKQDAIKQLHYYGRGFVEAKRRVETIRTLSYGTGTCYGYETKKVYELN